MTELDDEYIRMVHGDGFRNDAEALAASRKMNTALIEIIMELNKIHMCGDVPENEFNQGFEMKWCIADHEPWPCRTARAIGVPK